MKAIRVGIVGFGTVGKATARVVEAHRSEIEARCGAQLLVSMVCNRGPIACGDVPAGARVQTDWREVVGSPEVDIVVETVGGCTPSLEIVEQALAHGKPVVTANKSLIADHGPELFRMAAQWNLPVGFEAAVAGGIPVVRSIAEGTGGDRLRAVYGILNGTANYVLSRMESQGATLEAALQDAQRNGFAERDPARDVDGLDVRDKLVILARLAFGGCVPLDAIPVTGIRGVAVADVLYGRRLAAVIRLIGAAELHGDRMQLSVRPWLVGKDSMLGQVTGVNNAVLVRGERSGTQMFFGRGAGGDATAVAVLSDLIEIAADLAGHGARTKLAAGSGGRREFAPCLTTPPAPWYLRLTVRDQPGVLARTASILATEGINIDVVMQERGFAKENLPFVITVEPCGESAIQRAVAALNLEPALTEPVLLLRMQLAETGNAFLG